MPCRLDQIAAQHVNDFSLSFERGSYIISRYLGTQNHCWTNKRCATPVPELRKYWLILKDRSTSLRDGYSLSKDTDDSMVKLGSDTCACLFTWSLSLKFGGLSVMKYLTAPPFMCSLLFPTRSGGINFAAVATKPTHHYMHCQVHSSSTWKHPGGFQSLCIRHGAQHKQVLRHHCHVPFRPHA